MKRCYSCFKEYGDAYSVCPHCGKPEIKHGKEPIHLVPGTVLGGRYVIGESVGSGGFGIVYKAWDTKFENVVAIKEFFVPRLMTRAQGLENVIINKKTQVEFEYRRERFLAEARTMAKFGRHRSIPNVFEFFEENNTAYIVMELLQGMTLSDYIKQLKGKISVDFAVTIAIEIANALKSLHDEGIIHRDVAPDNIFICGGKNIRLKLMDLGAAKLADSTDDVVDIILKPGYSPVEQYDNVKDIGPWTDIYALGATIYAAVTGVKPEESTDRKKDDQVVEPMELNPEISENLNNTIMKAMALETHMRFKSADELIEALNGDRKVIPVHIEKKHRCLKRNISVITACLIVLIVGGILAYNTYTKNDLLTIESGTIIDVWCAIDPKDATQSEKDQMEEIKGEFEAYFNERDIGITVNLRIIPENEYKQELETAYEEGDLPALFESTGLSDDFLLQCGVTTLDEVRETDEYQNSYAKYYGGSKLKIPLALNCPVAVVLESNQNGSFNDLSEFGDTKIFYNENSTVVSKNFGKGSYALNEFLEEQIPYSVLLTDTESIITVDENFYRSYSILFFTTESPYYEFTREWSICGNADEEELKGAKILLTHMLGEAYQRILSDSSVPVYGNVAKENPCFKDADYFYAQVF